MALRRYERILGWVKRNERWLSSLVFVFGFVSDLATFGLLDLSLAVSLFELYLVFAALCTVVSHVTVGRGGSRFTRTLAVLAPLFAQFTIGSLLSGFLIFYTKSSVLSVSWPFILLLGSIFLGNEIFRNYRQHLIFQTVLLYFSLYAFAIFALPIYLGKIGRTVFLQSTLASIVLFAAFLLVLGLIGWKRLKSTLLPISVACAIITALIVGAYLTSLLPPIPLTLKEAGIYHSVVRTNDGYEVRGEANQSWWNFHTPVVHLTSNDSLYAFSSVFAPTTFSTGIVHRWQWFDPSSTSWKDEAIIAFTLSGGREGGYRGYSIKSTPVPGKWRVLVETLDGQVIGRVPFIVEYAAAEPALDTKAR